jgi:uncharacterized protein involved in exopolysaccharide biosynthesis
MEKHIKQFFGAVFILVGLALVVPGLIMLFGPDQFAATVKVKVEIDIDESSHSAPSRSQTMYDPYFIQTTFEIIQSHLILSNVVVSVDLNNKWGKRMADGSALTTQQSMAIIQQHLKLDSVRGTKLITITYYSRDPNEAAQIPNAIAKSYHNYRSEARNRYASSGLKILQEQFESETKQILALQANVEKLHQELGVQDTGATNRLPEQQPYWEAKEQLETIENLHVLLKKKIDEGKKDFLTTRYSSLVQITDPAETPKRPVGPNRTLGAVEAALGLLLLCGGVFLLKPARD